MSARRRRPAEPLFTKPRELLRYRAATGIGMLMVFVSLMTAGVLQDRGPLDLLVCSIGAVAALFCIYDAVAAYRYEKNLHQRIENQTMRANYAEAAYDRIRRNHGVMR